MDRLTFQKYSKLARRTEAPLSPDNRLLHHTLGIADEAGEISKAVKAYIAYGQSLNTDNIVEEIGDALWFLACLADTCGTTLEEAAKKNIAKLEHRYARGEFDAKLAMARLDKQE